MPGIVRIGDNSTSDPCGAPPHPPTAGSGNVFVNGIPAVRVGDPYAPHPCPASPPHGSSASKGSGTVFVNKIPVHRIGDDISCGSKGNSGSGDVIAGG
jgi:uncharacterized Zn-binding protein involved in type VI secretion